MPITEYDSIVIGAGIGGLTAAAKLVNSGQRVLVIEKNTHPGGTAYAYQRRGFTFPMGPLGFSNRVIVSGILKELGFEEEFEYHRIHYCLKAYGFEIPLSLPFNKVAEELIKQFPAESNAIKHFFDTVSKYEGACRLQKTGADFVLPDEITRISAQEYLNEMTSDDRLRRILGSQGTSEPYSSMMMLIAMWHVLSHEGIWYPRGGLKGLCDRLVLAVEGNMDTIRSQTVTGIEKVVTHRGTGLLKLRTEVKRILVDKSKIKGVELADGSAIHAKSVISNADYKTTFLTLLPQDDLPPEWYRAVSQARQTGSVLQICLGVNNDRCDLSVFRFAGRLIYRRDTGASIEDKVIDWNASEVAPEMFACQELEVSLLSKDDSNLAPPGDGVIVIRKEAPYSYFSRFRLGKGRRTADYKAYKNKLAQALINEVGYIIPGFNEAIKVIDIATPLTFEDQGGRSEGAIAGWSWDYRDSRNSEPRELIQTPIEGLFMAGYQAFSTLFLGGVPTAMESGRRAAQAVLDGTSPTAEVLIPTP